MMARPMTHKWGAKVHPMLNPALMSEKSLSKVLTPLHVSVELLPGEPKSCRVTVPDNQLSLAIGNKGQNARLTARLTGYNIDIRPESGYFGEEEAPSPAEELAPEAAE